LNPEINSGENSKLKIQDKRLTGLPEKAKIKACDRGKSGV